jgi:hypothetical protein
MAGPGAPSIPLLAAAAVDAVVVCRANSAGEGMAGSQEVDLNRRVETEMAATYIEIAC